MPVDHREKPEHRPGSPHAVARGCTCPLQRNNFGRGAAEPDGGPLYFIDLKCPVHGRTVIELTDWKLNEFH